MPIDKRETPVWMKAVIWLVAISFIGTGVVVVAAGFGGSGDGSAADTAGDGLSAIAAKYQPTIEATDAALGSDPMNYDLLVSQGNTYFDWAVEVVNTSGFSTVDRPLWLSAVSFYDRALEVNPEAAASVYGDRAFALYYSNSTDAKAALELFVERDPDDTTGQLQTAQEMLADLAAAPAPSEPTTGSATETTTP